MRELALIELDLVIGGYGESYDYGGYTFADDGAGNAVGEISQADYTAGAAGATAEGWSWGVDGTYSPNAGWGVKVSVSKKS